MQRDEMAGDAALLQRREQLRGEVQTCRWGGDGAFLAGIGRLVVAGIGLVRRALAGDVGRQRQFAEPRDRLVEIGAGQQEAQTDIAALPLVLDLGLQPGEFAGIARPLAVEDDRLADRELLGRTGEGAPAIIRLALVQHDLDAGRGLAAIAPPPEPRGNDAGIVQHQGIARPQQLDEVTDAAILERLGRVGADDEQPRCVARTHGPQRNAFLGQIEIKETDVHGPILKSHPGPTKSTRDDCIQDAWKRLRRPPAPSATRWNRDRAPARRA